MNRKKLLTTNIFVYGLGGVISKLIPLIMVPIITRLFPSAFYFGLNDLSTTITSLFSSIALMGMYDALFRLFFDKGDDNYKKEICSTAFIFVSITSTVIMFLLIILQKPISTLFYTDQKYGNLVMLCALSVWIGTTNSILSAPTRMQNKKFIFLFFNIFGPIISYAVAIPLILKGHYILAFPLASLISSTISEIAFYIINHKWFKLKLFNKKYLISMLKIALPLIPNFIIYWVFNSSDRVMIAHILGTTDDGIYSVAAKIGQVSNLIYTAFAGGWQFFSFSIMKDNDNVSVISRIFEGITLIALTTTILGTSICEWGMKVIFTSEYLPGYICVPYLYISPLLLLLFQIGTNQFLVIKKTWYNIIFLVSGAVINIILNLVLIPILGIEGACIATFAGYFISIILSVVFLWKFKLIAFRKKYIFLLLGFFVAFSIMRLNAFRIEWINVPVAVCYSIFAIILYWKDIRGLFNSVDKKKSNKQQLEVHMKEQNEESNEKDKNEDLEENLLET